MSALQNDIETCITRVEERSSLLAASSSDLETMEVDFGVDDCFGFDTKVSVKTKNNIAVILGYYEGEAHVTEQLESIFNQSYKALHVFVCDDRSSVPFNASSLKLDSDNLAKLSVGLRANNVGFTHNFLNALASIDDSFDYFAFSDQDDVWNKDKVETAINALSKVSNDLPALYCARTEIVDETGENVLGYSPIFSKRPSFSNALVQNIGGGNTMVFNKFARDLIVESSRNKKVVSHDWWCYQIIAGAGGNIIYDPKPCLKYRQHNNNQVGSNTGLSSRLKRIRGLTNGRFRAWNDTNIQALNDNIHMLTKENKFFFEVFVEARNSSLFKRIFFFKRAGIYRQTFLGNLGLFVGILLNKV